MNGMLLQRASGPVVTSQHLPATPAALRIRARLVLGAHSKLLKPEARTQPSVCSVATVNTVPLTIDEQLSTSASPRHEEPLPIDWFDQWYPVAFVSDLDQDVLHRIPLMGIPLCIWWDRNAGAWQAFKDLCPHRLVPLSEGRVSERTGHLECGYHGWQFSTSGACSLIPQGARSVGSPRACATVFPSAERQGLLFVKPTALPPASSKESFGQALAAAVQDEARIPIVPELEEEGWVPQDVWRDLPMDWATLLENVLDSSHVPFTHHKSMSDRNSVGAYDLKLTSPLSKDGFTGAWQTGPRAGKLGAQRTFWTAPSFMYHRLDSEARGFSSLTVVYAVPSRPGHCRLINRNVIKFHKGGLPALFLRLYPKFLSHVSSHVLLEDDQIFLHLGEEEFLRERAHGKTAAQAYYMPSPADTYVVQLHKWIDQFGGGGPFGPASPQLLAAHGPRLDRATLFDRYTQHTQGCATCQAALQQVKAVQFVMAASATAAAAAVLLCAATTIMAHHVGAVAWFAQELMAGQTNLRAGIFLSVAEAGLGLLRWMVGDSLLPQLLVLHTMVWAAIWAAATLAQRALADFERKFYQGTYPPPRNASMED